MKPSLRSIILTASFVIGYSGVAVFLHPHHYDTLPERFSRDQAAHSTSADPGVPLPAGPTLESRIATCLKLLGIENSWAAPLAADDTSGFPLLIEKLTNLPSGHKSVLMEILLDRWATLDALGGVAFFKAANDEENLTGLFSRWGQIDFEAASSKAVEYGEKAVRRTLREKALNDPAGFLTWCRQHPDINPLSVFNSGPGENDEALDQLAALDPDRMLAWSKEVPDDRWNAGFPHVFAARLAKRSPDEAIAWAKSLNDPMRSQAALCGAAAVLAASRPDRALALLSEMPAQNDYEIRKLYPAIFANLDLGDPDKALGIARALPPGDFRTMITERTLTNFFRTDPARAFALQDAAGPDGGALVRSNLAFAVKDPAAARRILEAAPQAADSSYRQHAAKSALLIWMQSDPASLGVWLKDRMDSPIISGMRTELQQGLALMSLQTGKPADAGLLAVLGTNSLAEAGVLMEIDPAGAAATLERVTDPYERTEILSKVLTFWVPADRQEALAWSGTLTNQDDQSLAVSFIANNWLKEDSYQASAWISSLPGGEARDAAVMSMTNYLAAEDPETALAWMETITSPGIRLKSALALAVAMSRQDAGAAENIADHLSLNPTDRARLLQETGAQLRNEAIHKSQGGKP